MQVIRTRSFSTILRRWFYAAVAVILLVAATAALADKPPPLLVQAVMTTARLVHRGDCTVKSISPDNVKCVIFYDDEREVVWLVLFDTQDGQLAETHVIAVKDKKETIVWCREKLCS